MSVWIVHLDKVCDMGTIVYNKDKNKQFFLSIFKYWTGQDHAIHALALSPYGQSCLSFRDLNIKTI